MGKQHNNGADEDRRAFLELAGKAAIVVPPAMTVLLATGMNSPALAASGSFSVGGGGGEGGGGGFLHGNNGVGNGIDPQPPGNPPINDGPGTGPGNPGNRGGPNR